MKRHNMATCKGTPQPAAISWHFVATGWLLQAGESIALQLAVVPPCPAVPASCSEVVGVGAGASQQQSESLGATSLLLQ